MNINSDNNQNNLGDTLDWKFDDSDTVHYKIGMEPDTLFLYIPIEYKDRPNEYFTQNPFTLYYEYTEPINIKLNDIYVYYYIKIINKIKVFLKKVI